MQHTQYIMWLKMWTPVLLIIDVMSWRLIVLVANEAGHLMASATKRAPRRPEECLLRLASVARCITEHPGPAGPAGPAGLVPRSKRIESLGDFLVA